METILPGIETNQDGAGLVHTPGSRRAGPRQVHRPDRGIIAFMTARLVVLGRDPMALDCSAEKIEGFCLGITDLIRSGEPKGKPCNNLALRFVTIDCIGSASGFSTPMTMPMIQFNFIAHCPAIR